MSMDIGQKVKIVRLREKVPPTVIEKAKKGAVGTVKDYKMTDGSGIGVVVEFDDKTSTWFFEDELTPLD
jgi:ppGpp synthetase/RelA/SpoT-type nucleotidyltranferase